MSVVLFEGIWGTKPLTGCQIESLLLIFALSLLISLLSSLLLSLSLPLSLCLCLSLSLSLSVSLSLSLATFSDSNSVTLPYSLFRSLACLQVVCCSQCGPGVQTLQTWAAHETVLLGTFPKCGTTKACSPRWFHPRRLPFTVSCVFVL